MKFEDKLKLSLTVHNDELDDNVFIANIHEKRFNNFRKRQQLTQTLLGGMLILMFGFLTVESLEQSPIIYDFYAENNQEFMEIDTSAYLDDMALFLVNSGEDIFETATFLYELDIDLLPQGKEI
jgi:hypothetical protein|tara:strand:- start:180 stop:551 length:372 start_codon:yes stop_codon:yes gene_type:complete